MKDIKQYKVNILSLGIVPLHGYHKYLYFNNLRERGNNVVLYNMNYSSEGIFIFDGNNNNNDSVNTYVNSMDAPSSLVISVYNKKKVVKVYLYYLL